MTWNEIRLKTLQLMFSNETAELTVDDGNEEYINAMPGVANDALSMVTQFLPLRRKLVIEITADAAEQVEEPEEPTEEEAAETDRVTLPLDTGAQYRIDLLALRPDFRALDAEEIYLDRDGTHSVMTEYSVENDSVLVLDGGREETVTIYYRAYPAIITSTTDGDTELGVAREAAEIIPLYMAGELYKDDDISMAVQYRNEFEDALQKLRQTAQRRPRGSAAYRNTTGWW